MGRGSVSSHAGDVGVSEKVDYTIYAPNTRDILAQHGQRVWIRRLNGSDGPAVRLCGCVRGCVRFVVQERFV